ncbi:MAG: PilT/PilU family type 4a pilus ATPase [Clostridiales bacterium]|nr:PilT/PilU family type 4a pilus ATPase [Clostridiales bacterium]
MDRSIREIVAGARAKNASDVHIVCGIPVRYRINGSLVSLDEEILTEKDCIRIANELTDGQYEEVAAKGEMDFAATVSGVRCRLNLFMQQRCVSTAVRLLQDSIPAVRQLSLPPIVETFAAFQRGIVIVTGETGSGKSTTLAALLDEINHTRAEHIITLEDPIEYVYKPDKCTINQREIGIDTESYSSGLKAILREDPDIILIGEMRTLDTIETALVAAETGHLVFATLHTNSAPNTIDRIVDVFPAEKQQQIRLQLSMTLRAVLAQQLLVKKDGSGRIAACEVMIPTDAIRSLIREAKTPQIVNALATSAAEGNITMDNYLIKMVRDGIISKEAAVSAAVDAAFVKRAVGASGMTQGKAVMMR